MHHWSRVLIESAGRRPVLPEFASVERAAEALDLPVTYASEKQFVRRRVALDATTLVAARLPAMRAAMTCLGIEHPEPNDYPTPLHSFLGRAVWRSTLADVRARFEHGHSPLFIKPAVKTKRFTGLVVSATYDLRGLHGVSKHTPIWCSEVLELVSEHRVFVARGRIVGRRHYSGNAANPLSDDVAEAAVSALESSGEAKRGYTLDFGITNDGSTVLIEHNEGYSIGAYGLGDAAYFAVLEARWQELLEARRPRS